MTPRPTPARMKVDQLRAELRARSLDVSGTKQVLVARLQEALAAEAEVTQSMNSNALTNGNSSPSGPPSVVSRAATAQATLKSPKTPSPFVSTNHGPAGGSATTPDPVSTPNPARSVPQSRTASGPSAVRTPAVNGASNSLTGPSMSVEPVVEEKIGSIATDAKGQVLFAPEKMTMEERLAARARRFGIKPVDDTTARATETSVAKVSKQGPAQAAADLSGSRKQHSKTRRGSARENVDSSMEKKEEQEDSKPPRAGKRERPPDVVAAEVVSPEELALRAKRAKRLGLSQERVAQS